MEFFDLAKKRYSMLHYDTRRIEAAVLDKILEAGMLAPTACNNQPQRILIIRTPERKEKLEKICKSGLYYDTALLVCYDKTACWTRSFDQKSSGEIDASIVTTHMMLQATDLGVGSIWVMNWDPARMRAAFDLADELEPVALLILGYPGKDAAPRPGHAKSKILTEVLI